MTYQSQIFDWSRAWTHGERLAEEQTRKGDKVDDVAIMWALMREAVRTSALCDSAPPRSHWPSKSSWPENPDEISAWHMTMAWIRGELDDAPKMRAKPAQPSAAAISRRDNVLHVWHEAALRDTPNWLNKRMALHAYAAGAKSAAVCHKSGLSRQSLSSAKQRAMQDMVDYINRLTNGQFRA